MLISPLIFLFLDSTGVAWLYSQFKKLLIYLKDPLCSPSMYTVSLTLCNCTVNANQTFPALLIQIESFSMTN